MFQDARLLPWKRVIDNITLGLDDPQALARGHEALAHVGLADRANDWPAVLSGGQRQRVSWRVPWCIGPGCCCWTSRSAHSMRSPASRCTR